MACSIVVLILSLTTSSPRAYDAPAEVVALDLEVPQPVPAPQPSPPMRAPPQAPASTQIDGSFPLGRSGRLMRYDKLPEGRGSALLASGGVIAVIGVVTAGLSFEGGLGSSVIAVVSSLAAPPMLAGGAVLRARAQAYNDVWRHNRPLRDFRWREGVAWSAFAVGAGIAAISTLTLVLPGPGSDPESSIYTSRCGGSCTEVLYVAWISGVLATVVALPGASHATAYRRRAHDLAVLRGRAYRSGLGQAAFGALGPPRRAGTGRIAIGATAVAVAGILLPAMAANGGDAAGVVLLPALGVATVLGGSGLIVSGALARHRANAWRAHTSRVALAPSLSPRLMGVMLHGRI